MSQTPAAAKPARRSSGSPTTKPQPKIVTLSLATMKLKVAEKEKQDNKILLSSSPSPTNVVQHPTCVPLSLCTNLSAPEEEKEKFSSTSNPPSSAPSPSSSTCEVNIATPHCNGVPLMATAKKTSIDNACISTEDKNVADDCWEDIEDKELKELPRSTEANCMDGLCTDTAALSLHDDGSRSSSQRGLPKHSSSQKTPTRLISFYYLM